MPEQQITRLRQAFNFRLSELMKFDLAVGVLGGAGGACAGVFAPEQLAAGSAVAGSFVGVVIGAVIAGLAIQGAFLDQAFLRKLRVIGGDPVRHMAPFLFSAALGVIAGLILIALAFVPPTAPTVALAVVAGLGGFTSTWALASLVPALDTLVQFVRLRDDASLVPDDVAEPRQVRRAG